MPGPRWPHVADCPSSENEPIVSGGSRMSTFVRCAIPGHARSSRQAHEQVLPRSDLTWHSHRYIRTAPAPRTTFLFPRLAGFSSNARSPTQKKRQAGLRPRGRLSVMTALALWHLFLVATAHAFTPTKTFATFGACERARVASPPRGVRPARLCDPRYDKRRAHQGSARPPVAVQQRAQQGRIGARPHVAHLPRLRLRQETTRPRR